MCVNASISLNHPLACRQLAVLRPLEYLTKAPWEDGLWSDNLVVFCSKLRLSLGSKYTLPIFIAWLLWKRRSLA